MGSSVIQGQLWGKQPENWAEIQEPTSNAGYAYVLGYLNPGPSQQVLDIGCGSGLFSKMASETGAYVTGIDASKELIAQAIGRESAAKFTTGEMEALPFADETFDIVCGFNSYQYAADTRNALMETRRVLKIGGKIAVMIWGNKEDCEAATYLKAVGSLLPPPPPGAPGPFALSENEQLENLLTTSGYKIIDKADVDTVWDYKDKETAIKGLMAAGPAARAIENTSNQEVNDAILQSMQPYIKTDGHVVYKNKFRVVIAEK